MIPPEFPAHLPLGVVLGLACWSLGTLLFVRRAWTHYGLMHVSHLGLLLITVGAGLLSWASAVRGHWVLAAIVILPAVGSCVASWLKINDLLQNTQRWRRGKLAARGAAIRAWIRIRAGWAHCLRAWRER